MARARADGGQKDLDYRQLCLLWTGGLCCEVIGPCQGCLAVYFGRIEVAKKYGIPENMPKDVFCSFCCCCCAASQVQEEVMLRENLDYACMELVPKGPAQQEMTS